MLYSHNSCEWVFYIRYINNKRIPFFYIPIFPPQATPKISELLYTDILYTTNLDAISAAYNIKHFKQLLKLREHYQQLAKQQLAKYN